MGLFSFLFSKKRINRKLKIGLVLSGGGAKGVCHIGVLRAFEEQNIKFDYIAGTSAGSLVGAAIAAGRTSAELEKMANSVKVKNIRTSKIFFVPSKTIGLQSLVKDAIGGDLDFCDLRTKFYAVAVCLNTGKQKVFEKGNVAKSVAASCCAPGFFVPVEIDGQNYVDGGLLNNIPTNVLRDKFCDVIIAVDLGATKKIGTDSTKTIDTLLTSYKIMASLNGEIGKQLADVVIKPDLAKFKATKLDNSDSLIQEGYISTQERMPQILEILRTKKPIHKSKYVKLKKKENKKYYKQRIKSDAKKKKNSKK